MASLVKYALWNVIKLLGASVSEPLFLRPSIAIYICRYDSVRPHNIAHAQIHVTKNVCLENPEEE